MYLVVDQHDIIRKILLLTTTTSTRRDPLVADQHFHQVEQQGNGSNGAVFQQSDETKDSDGLPHPKVGGQSFKGMR